ncbi:MAG: hypothetical protein ACRC2W_02230 [Plesiomonas shigelloides]
MKQYFILGGFLVASAAIISTDKIQDSIQFNNTMNLESGKVRLGSVYREIVESNFEVTFEGQTEPSLQVSENTANLYSTAYEQLEQLAKELNNDRKLKKQEPLSINELAWTKNATIKLSTTVTYASEFQPKFILTIDTEEMKYVANTPESKNVIYYIEELKNYSAKMLKEYETNHSFIN